MRDNDQIEVMIKKEKDHYLMCVYNQPNINSLFKNRIAKGKTLDECLKKLLATRDK